MEFFATMKIVFEYDESVDTPLEDVKYDALCLMSPDFDKTEHGVTLKAVEVDIHSDDDFTLDSYAHALPDVIFMPSTTTTKNTKQ